MLPVLLAIPAFIALVFLQGFLPTVTDVNLRRTLDTGYAFTEALSDLVIVNSRRSVSAGLLLLPSAPNSPTGPLYQVKGLSMKGPILAAVEHLNLYLDAQVDPAYDVYSSSAFEDEANFFDRSHKEEQHRSYAHSTGLHATSIGDMSVLLFDDSRARRPVCSAPARTAARSVSSAQVDRFDHGAELLNRYGGTSFRALLVLALLWHFVAQFWRTRRAADERTAMKALALIFMLCESRIRLHCRSADSVS